MNFIEAYFLNRALSRIYTTTAIYGSCHSQMTFRSKWNPLRYVLGSLKYKFFHPADIVCKCDWEDVLPRTMEGLRGKS